MSSGTSCHFGHLLKSCLGLEFPSAVIILKLNNANTVKILNIRTPKTFAVITLKFEQDGFTEE